MKLYLSPTSPFARKVRVALSEKALGERTEYVMLDPWTSPEALLAVNPLSQVPTLVLDEGIALTGSDGILGALESLHPVPPLFPSETEAQMRTLAAAGLAHGLIECTVQIVLERRRPADRQSETTIERRRGAVERVVHKLEADFEKYTDRFLLDGIGVAVALAYLDFRLPEYDWRSRSPRLADWQDWAAARRSMRESAPPS